jgi:hypothetical protein
MLQSFGDSIFYYSAAFRAKGMALPQPSTANVATQPEPRFQMLDSDGAGVNIDI